MKMEARGRGRPTKFKPEFVVLVRRLRERFDAPADDIALILGIDPSTLRGWARANHDLRAAMGATPDVGQQYREFSLRAATDALSAVVELSARRKRSRLPASLETSAVVRSVVAAALKTRRRGVRKGEVG